METAQSLLLHPIPSILCCFTQKRNKTREDEKVNYTSFSCNFSTAKFYAISPSFDYCHFFLLELVSGIFNYNQYSQFPIGGKISFWKITVILLHTNQIMPCTKIPRSGFVHSLSHHSLFLIVPLPDQRHSGPTGQFPMISFWNLSHCEETKSPKPLCLRWGMHVSVHVCALYLSLIPTQNWGLDRMSLWSMISYQLWKTDHWKWQGHGVCKIVKAHVAPDICYGVPWTVFVWASAEDKKIGISILSLKKSYRILVTYRL